MFEWVRPCVSLTQVVMEQVVVLLLAAPKTLPLMLGVRGKRLSS